MLIAAIVVIGVLLFLAFVLAMARRSDTREAVGVLSRETMRRDRSAEAVKPLEEEAPRVTGRDVERMAIERSARTGTAVEVAPSLAPELAAPPPPVDLEALGVTRRQFLNRAVLGVTGLSVAGFGAACLAFLWSTTSSGGFGLPFTFSKDVVDSFINASPKGPFYNGVAQAYINAYPPENVPKAIASKAYSDAIVSGMRQGYVALWQRCVHLGCRVPWCFSSQWFECPCHGSQYNRVGEKKGGPAPRGLDHFPLTVDPVAKTITINTSPSVLSIGPPIGTNTTGQEAEGPHCH